MFSVAFGWLLVVIGISLNIELPPLVRTTHKGYSLPPINVTVGERFSLPLPYFDTPFQQQSFKAYRINEEQFKQYSPVAEGKGHSKGETEKGIEQETVK